MKSWWGCAGGCAIHNRGLTIALSGEHRVSEMNACFNHCGVYVSLRVGRASTDQGAQPTRCALCRPGVQRLQFDSDCVPSPHVVHGPFRVCCHLLAPHCQDKSLYLFSACVCGGSSSGPVLHVSQLCCTPDECTLLAVLTCISLLWGASPFPHSSVLGQGPSHKHTYMKGTPPTYMRGMA